MKTRLGLVTLCMTVAIGCGDDGGTTDTGTADTGTADTGVVDTGAADSAMMDGSTTDSGGTDSGGADTAVGDAATDGSTSCTSDSDCAAGTHWCVGGECVECDNSGLACDIACAFGWETYERNGCFPCTCAPQNECTNSADCAGGGECYAGDFCWDYCPAGDPTCCMGNLCESVGCPAPPPLGCIARGCPAGTDCQDFATSGVCVSSSCSCSDGSWICTDDCGGGSCVTP